MACIQNWSKTSEMFETTAWPRITRIWMHCFIHYKR